MACGMTTSRFLARLISEPITLLRVIFIYIWLRFVKPNRRIELWDLNSKDPKRMGGLVPEEYYKMENAQIRIDSNMNDSSMIYGSNSSGAALVARVCREREGHVAWLYLKLSDGRSYHLPYPDKSYPPKDVFLAGGLRMICLRPMHKWRVSYNGLLRETTEDCASTESKLLHVKFSFTVFMNSYPFDLATDIDSIVLADYMARARTYKSARITKFLDYYVQPCNLIGTIVIDGKNEMEVFLWGLRKRSRDIQKVCSEGTLKWKELFGYSKEGQIIYSAEYHFPDSKERFSVGHFVERNSLIWPVKRCKTTFELDKDLFTGLKVNFKTAMCNVQVIISEPVQSVSFVSGHGFGHLDRVNLTNMQFQDGDQGPALVIEHTGTKYESKPLDKLDWRLPLSGPALTKKMSTSYILTLEDPECQKIKMSGGKGSSLAALSYLVRNYISGFEVPWGFVITTRAYWEFFSRANLHPLIAQCETQVRLNDITEMKNSCNEFMNQVSKAKLPGIIGEEIRKQLLSRFPIDIDFRRFAVRSSSSGEDSEEMSAAGQMSTILGVEGLESIFEAVVKCWASQFSFTAVQYKRQNGQELNSPMAVVVQEMVPADTAGVLFTCDPVTGNPQNVIITANYGLGESVVSASAEPDTLVMRRDEKNHLTIQSVQVGRKKTKIVMSDVGNVIEKCNDEEEASACCLSNEEALALAETCIKVEDAYGLPLDVEWAFKDGRLSLLQARPITTFNKETNFEIIHNSNSPIRIENEYLTKANIGEVMPGFISQVTCSMVGSAFTFNLQNFFGKRNKYMLPYSPFNSMAIIMQGQAFFGMSDNFLRFHEKDSKSFITEAMLYGAFGRNIEDEDMLEQAHKRHRNYPEMFTAPPLLYIIGDILFGGKILDKEIKKAWSDEIDLSNCSNSKEMIQTIWNAMLNGQKGIVCHIVNTINSSICNSIIMSILAEENKGMDVNVFSDLSIILSSCGKLESADIPLSIQRLSREIRSEMGMKAFRAMDPEEAVEWLERTDSCAGKLYKEFLRRHGHRCLKEFDLYSRPWRVNKLPLIKILQDSAFENNIENKQELSTNEVISKLKIPLSRKSKILLKILIPICRGCVLNREKSKSLTIKTIDIVRKAFWTVADRCVTEGILPNQELAFFLSHHELVQLFDTRSPSLIQSAIRRKQIAQELDSRRYSEICKGIPVALNTGNKLNQDDFETDLEITGTPVSQGIAKGLARVATNLDEASKIQPGEILIAYCTDIAWSPYFPLLSGVATELGGLVSHGAVVAREYGLPCVVGVHNATNRFQSGDEVLLDGNTGKLRRISTKFFEHL